jgi:hypothetical protein
MGFLAHRVERSASGFRGTGGGARVQGSRQINIPGEEAAHDTYLYRASSRQLVSR